MPAAFFTTNDRLAARQLRLDDPEATYGVSLHWLLGRSPHQLRLPDDGCPTGWSIR